MDMPGAEPKPGPDDWGRWRGTANGSRKMLVPTAQAQQVAWRYSFEKPGDTWMQPEFNDAAWKEGAAPFGTPDHAIARNPRTAWTTQDLWLRRTFEWRGRTSERAVLLIHFDEDAEVYINGVLAGKFAGYNAAYEPREPSPQAIAALKPGQNVMAVHCHQTVGGQYIDLGISSAVDPAGEKTEGRFWDSVAR
jgi:hypothetical protein